MTNLNLDIALKYARMGWKIFPCYWHDGHKPCIKWSGHSSSNPKDIQSWADKWPKAYFCVALQQSDLTVIDIDNKDGKVGSDVLFDLEFDHTTLPETLKVATPSEGFHYIFKGKSPMTVSKLGAGIDTPVMVPLPGTVIEGKGAYKLLVDSPLMGLPEWVRKLVGAVALKKERKDVVDFELDLPDNMKKAALYLMKEAPIAYEGDGGDLVAYRVACKVRDYGISETLCLNEMLALWNERCEPPWSIEELQKKVNNAYQYAQEPIGRSTPEADFTAIPLPQDETFSHKVPGKEGPQLIHIKAFSGAPPKRKWLVEGLLPKDEVSAIYGAGGMGKSLLSIQLALNVASGKGEFLGFDITDQMPTLIVSYEDKKEELHRRIHNIKRAEEYEFLSLDIPFWVCPMVGENGILGVQMNNSVKHGVFLASLREKILKVKGDAKDVLVILDTLSDIFAVNENDREAASYCIKTILGGLVKALGCTILVVAHPSKSAIRDKTFSSGSTGWPNSFRNVLALGPHENENLKTHRMFYQIKSNYTAPFEPMTLKYEQGRYLVADDGDIVDLVYEKNVAKVLEVITEQCKQDPPMPLGLHPNKKPSFRALAIPNAAGGLLGKDIKDKIITELMADGIVREIRGHSKRSENGLWPVSMLSKKEDF